jgi:GTP-binding protein EngB required for normal cell division
VNDTDGLLGLMRVAAEAGAADVAAEAAGLAERAAEGRFYVALVGEFKRGKSTLINALLGGSVLPVGVVPVTSVPTVVRYGDPAARVRENGRWRPIGADELTDYVAQSANPGNAKGVTGVEVFHPHPLLRTGLCLVDTPGLGSVFEANTTSTADFMPHIDAAIVVLGADPPISGEELRFTADLARQVSTLLFVLNKADRIPADHLEESLGRTVAPLYQVSAISPDRGPDVPYGWRQFVSALEALPGSSGRRIVLAAVRRGQARLGRLLAATLVEERRALLAPLAESDRRVAILADLAAGAERSRRELEALLALEERALAETFERRREEYLDRALQPALTELEQRLQPQMRRAAALALANEIARVRLARWLEESEREAEAAYATAVARFGRLASEFLERAATSASIDRAALGVDETVWSGLQAARGFRFADLLDYHVSPLPWAGVLDRLLPGVLARRGRLGAARHYQEHLVRVNATRVESDLRDRVRESRLRLQRELDHLLRQVGDEARRAAVRGRAARAAGDVAVRDQLARVTAWLAELKPFAGGAE